MYTHGAPQSINVLAAVLSERSFEHMWQGYVADLLCACAKGIYGLGGKRLDVDPYTSIRNRIDKPAKKRPEMTGDEVLEHILSEVSALGGNERNGPVGNAGA